MGLDLIYNKLLDLIYQGLNFISYCLDLVYQSFESPILIEKVLGLIYHLLDFIYHGHI